MPLTERNLRARFAEHTPKQYPKTPETPLAAVAAILRYPLPATPEVLLIRRTSRPSDPWSGHMALPGGRRDPGDTDLVATAVRETAEEVGFDLTTSADHLGQLDDIQAISRARAIDLLIVPHVFVMRRAVDLTLEAKEVAEALWTPLAPMVAGEIDTVRPYVHEGKALELPGYRVGEHIVWGLTYRMLELLFELAT